MVPEYVSVISGLIISLLAFAVLSEETKETTTRRSHFDIPHGPTIRPDSYPQQRCIYTTADQYCQIYGNHTFSCRSNCTLGLVSSRPVLTDCDHTTEIVYPKWSSAAPFFAKLYSLLYSNWITNPECYFYSKTSSFWCVVSNSTFNGTTKGFYEGTMNLTNLGMIRVSEMKAAIPRICPPVQLTYVQVRTNAAPLLTGPRKLINKYTWMLLLLYVHSFYLA